MKRFIRITFLLLALLLFTPPSWAQESVVHALLFFSHTCPHCHKVINEDIPPLKEKYGDQLIVLGINTASEQGSNLYHAAVEYYQIPPERLGVPTLIINDTVLVGSLEIPDKFPDLIEAGLAAGGIDWPDIPALQKLLDAGGIVGSEDPERGNETRDISQNKPTDQVTNPTDEDTVVKTQPVIDEQIIEKTEIAAFPNVDEAEKDEVDMVEPSQENLSSKDKLHGISTNLEEATISTGELSLSRRFAQDKAGNTASVIVLMGMVLSVAVVGKNVARTPVNLKPWPIWVVFILVLIGLFVSIYLSYVEITETEAVCGPVGDCNTVQQSSYALLFGLIPIGVLGIAGYLLVGITWLFAVFGPKKWRKICILSSWLLCVFGALFSVYLTFLEPFVIGATCAWCLSSAILMHLLLWATTAPAIKVWKMYRLNIPHSFA